jgi:hypothetical protein
VAEKSKQLGLKFEKCALMTYQLESSLQVGKTLSKTNPHGDFSYFPKEIRKGHYQCGH